MTAGEFVQKWCYRNDEIYQNAVSVIRGFDAKLAEKAKRIAELEAKNAELAKHKPEKIADRCPSCGIRGLFVGTGGRLTCSNVECENPCVSNAIAALKPKFDKGQEVHIRSNGVTTVITEVMPRLTRYKVSAFPQPNNTWSEDELCLPQPEVTKNAEHAKPQFAVGDKVEWLPSGSGTWQLAHIKEMYYDYDLALDGGTAYGVPETRVRLPQPKVTKPTADEWYKAFCGEQNGDFKEMVNLARRHEATQAEEAK